MFDGSENLCELRQDVGAADDFATAELNVTIPPEVETIVQYDSFREADEDFYREHLRRSIGEQEEGRSGEIYLSDHDGFTK